MANLIDTLTHEAWLIHGWYIHFILSDQIIDQINQTTLYPVWDEHEALAQPWTEKLERCYTSIERCYEAFGWFPQVSDRLFGEDLGWMIKDRSIDGTARTITFTLTL